MVKQRLLLSILLLSLCACSVFRKLIDTTSGLQPTAVAVPRTKIIPQQKPLFVEFYSTLCAICKQIQPTINKIEDDYNGRFEFRAYDVAGIKDDLKSQFKFIGYPQIVILDSNGEIVFNRLGFQTYDSLKADLDAVLTAQQP